MLIVHRSERADYLVESLGDLLLAPLGDPMTAEVISVPTRGVERWLTQRLSHRLGATDGGDGVCANVEFPFPGSLIGEATAIACGFDRDSDPWPAQRSVWPLLEIVDENLEEPFLSSLAAHLKAGSPDENGDSRSLRRFATVRHLADLFDRYAVHRPEMIQDWASGELRADEVAADGVVPVNGPANLSGSQAIGDWQRELWQRLRERIGVPSPAERLETARAALAARPDELDLPVRLSLFGLTRLPASHLLILEAIAVHRDVHLFLLHPSAQLWETVEKESALVGPPVRRSDDRTAGLARNALLRSWGRDSREMQLVLRAHGVGGGEHRPVQTDSDGAPRLLRLIQEDIRADREPPGAPLSGMQDDARPLLDPADDSLRVHSCHGRLRQVEVMRDAILHLLAEDPTLEPRDVIVMCPDVESFAPLIHAVFGSGGPLSESERFDDRQTEPGPPQIRVRLADRSIRQTNPILGVAAQLLELAAGRLTASEVLDLASQEPVSRRFRFDEDDLSQLERWVADTGIRWGLDGAHRQPWKLERVEENTWRKGLDRLLLGVAMAEESQRLFNDVLPLDDVPSGAVDLAGRFAELVERLGSAVDALQARQSVSAWCDVLADATESLAAAAPDAQWQHDQLRRVLGEVAETAGDEDSSPLLDLAEVRSLLTDRLRGRPTRANFRTGDLTICTLVPMRSVPHRVVGLLGLDDGAFPRHAAFDGDDLLLADPQVGDRDGRSEDRQLLLDALLAATEHLIVTYEGRDPRTNQERSPCVPIAELLDVIDRTVRLGDRPGQPRSEIVIQHPLQSFDQRNFRADELVPEVPWSFDPVDLEGALALAETPQTRRPFLSAALEPLELPAVQLESLARFLEHPVRAFLRERLGWYGTRAADEVKDDLPIDLDALERWDIGARMLAARLGGATLRESQAVERGRGLLPPGSLGTLELADLEGAVEALTTATLSVASVTGGSPESIEINVRLPDGRPLIGTVPDIYEAEATGGDAELRIVRCEYSQLGPKHRVVAWARFLALTAARPESMVSAVTIGRGQGAAASRQRVAVVELRALEGSPAERKAKALEILSMVVDLYDRGMREPLPLYTKTSEKYVDELRRDEDPRPACRKVWESGPYSYGEDLEKEHRLVLGEVRFDQLLKEAPAATESGPGWGDLPSRFARLAVRLWEPLLAHEVRSYLA